MSCIANDKYRHQSDLVARQSKQQDGGAIDQVCQQPDEIKINSMGTSQEVGDNEGDTHREVPRGVKPRAKPTSVASDPPKKAGLFGEDGP